MTFSTCRWLTPVTRDVLELDKPFTLTKTVGDSINPKLGRGNISIKKWQ